jgi:hypothetical protein
MNDSVLHKIKSFQINKFLKIWLLFSCISLLSYLAYYPSYLEFENLFLDPGAGFKANELISNGYSPAVDFTYYYGLLPLVLGKVLFSVFGNNPQAFFFSVPIIWLLSSLSLARVVILANIGKTGIIFLAVSIPFFTFHINSASITHALEPVFILWALAEHLSGKRGNALAVLVLGYFTKPSMSFIYAVLILGLYANDLLKGKTNFYKVGREILPALLVTTSLLISLSIMFGIIPLTESILAPIKGAAIYKAYNYGLFGIGRSFIYFSGARLGYYLGSPSGFWIISTIILFVAVVFFLYKIFILNQNIFKNAVTEVIFCTATLHLIFIVRLFGNSWSWIFYSYLLTIGIALLDSKYLEIGKNKIRNLFICLTLLLLFGYYFQLSNSYKAWANFNPSLLTMGLNSTVELKKEFAEVLNYCQTKKVFILGEATGAIDVFFPKCKSPDAWMLLNGAYSQREHERVSSQIAQSDFIALYTPSFFDKFPEHILISYRQELEKFKSQKKGKYFEFLIRK